MEKYGMEKQENLLSEKYNLKIAINFRINKDKKMNIIKKNRINYKIKK